VSVVGTEVTVSSHQAPVILMLMPFITSTVVRNGSSAVIVIIARAISGLIVTVHSVAAVTKDVTVSGTEALYKTIPDSTNVIVIVNSTVLILISTHCITYSCVLYTLNIVDGLMLILPSLL